MAEIHQLKSDTIKGKTPKTEIYPISIGEATYVEKFKGGGETGGSKITLKELLPTKVSHCRIYREPSNKLYIYGFESKINMSEFFSRLIAAQESMGEQTTFSQDNMEEFLQTWSKDGILLWREEIPETTDTPTLPIEPSESVFSVRDHSTYNTEENALQKPIISDTNIHLVLTGKNLSQDITIKCYGKKEDGSKAPTNYYPSFVEGTPIKVENSDTGEFTYHTTITVDKNSVINNVCDTEGLDVYFTLKENPSTDVYTYIEFSSADFDINQYLCVKVNNSGDIIIEPEDYPQNVYLSNVEKDAYKQEVIIPFKISGSTSEYVTITINDASENIPFTAVIYDNKENALPSSDIEVVQKYKQFRVKTERLKTGVHIHCSNSKVGTSTPEWSTESTTTNRYGTIQVSGINSTTQVYTIANLHYTYMADETKQTTITTSVNDLYFNISYDSDEDAYSLTGVNTNTSDMKRGYTFTKGNLTIPDTLIGFAFSFTVNNVIVDNLDALGKTGHKAIGVLRSYNPNTGSYDSIASVTKGFNPYARVFQKPMEDYDSKDPVTNAIINFSLDKGNGDYWIEVFAKFSEDNSQGAHTPDELIKAIYEEEQKGNQPCIYISGANSANLMNDYDTVITPVIIKLHSAAKPSDDNNNGDIIYRNMFKLRNTRYAGSIQSYSYLTSSEKNNVIELPDYFMYNKEDTNFTDLDLTDFSNLKKIGRYAFAECSNLETVTLNDNITDMGKEAFADCRNLTSINIPSSVSKISDGLLRNVAIATITLPSNLNEIGDGAFADCINLTDIVIPDNVTKMGRAVFIRCTALQTVDLGTGVKEVNDGTFTGCTDLTDVYLRFIGTDENGNLYGVKYNMDVPRGLPIHPSFDSGMNVTVHVPSSLLDFYNNVGGFWTNCHFVSLQEGE